MSDLTQHDPTGRFTGRQDLYARFRPAYPAEAIDAVLRKTGLEAGGLLVDVGCGTGLSSRLFAERGVEVVGIEPNAAMREQAELAGGSVRYQEGRGEATGLPDGCARVVLAAQAFHWFDAPRALREFHRILTAGGWVALLGYERDETDPCTAAYGDVIRLAPDTALVEGGRIRAPEALPACPLFDSAEVITFSHPQELDEEGLVGRMFSSSYVPREPPLGPRIEQGVRQVFARFQHDGRVRLCQRVTLHLARKP
jgi:SAM-dependent methyltransferase